MIVIYIGGHHTGAAAANATAQGSLAAKPARGKVVRGSAAAAERIARHKAMQCSARLGG